MYRIGMGKSRLSQCQLLNTKIAFYYPKFERGGVGTAREAIRGETAAQRTGRQNRRVLP